MAGDGCLKKDGLHISVHWIDTEILALFRDNISPNSRIKFIKYDNTNTLIINSVKIMNDLCIHLKLDSYDKKSHKIRFPDISEDILIHFIRGLMDSDGWISDPLKRKGLSCSYCSMSDVIKTELQEFCNNRNIKSNISNNMVRFAVENAFNFLKLIYNNSEYSLTRKRCRAKMWMTWRKYKSNIFSPTIRKRGYTYIPSDIQLKNILNLNKSKRKLSKNDILEIKKLYSMNFSQKQISEKYNVSQSTICNILNNKFYKEIK